MSSDAPPAVTRDRRWHAVVEFTVRNTPDPNYDVAANDDMADKLAAQIKSVLSGIEPISAVVVEHLEASEQ